MCLKEITKYASTLKKAVYDTWENYFKMKKRNT